MPETTGRVNAVVASEMLDPAEVASYGLVPAMFHPRRTCYRCFRPEASCYCSALTRIENRTRVIVLQHPRERFHPLGTARILEQSLTRCEVLCAPPAQMGEALAQADVTPRAYLLFPDAEARELETLLPEEHPGELIVLDGTWHHAKTLLRDVPALRSFRRLRFVPQAPSNYRIRKEPDDNYLSTVESVAHVLSRVESGSLAREHLLRAFDFMIDRNIALRRPESHSTRRAKKAFAPHRFPELLHAVPERLVALHCEGSRSHRAEGTSDTSRRRSHEPLWLGYRRLVGGVEHRLVLRPRVRPHARLLSELGLCAQDLELALDPTSARAALEAELAPDDVLVAVHASSLRLLAQTGIEVRPQLQLKGIYCDFQNYLRGRPELATQVAGFVEADGQPYSWSELDEVLARHRPPGVAATAVAQGGTSFVADRGTLRLRQTIALLGFLRQVARDHLRSFE